MLASNTFSSSTHEESHFDEYMSRNLPDNSVSKKMNLSLCNLGIEQVINNIRIKNINRLIFGHLNINSLRNKFETLSSIVTNKLDIFAISETKLDNSFPTGQFMINGFSSPYRKDRDANGGGILIYVRDDIPSRSIINNDLPFEGILIEINLRKTKWLLCYSYNPPQISNFKSLTRN